MPAAIIAFALDSHFKLCIEWLIIPSQIAKGWRTFRGKRKLFSQCSVLSGSASNGSELPQDLSDETRHDPYYYTYNWPHSLLQIKRIASYSLAISRVKISIQIGYDVRWQKNLLEPNSMRWYWVDVGWICEKIWCPPPYTILTMILVLVLLSFILFRTVYFFIAGRVFHLVMDSQCVCIFKCCSCDIGETESWGTITQFLH